MPQMWFAAELHHSYGRKSVSLQFGARIFETSTLRSWELTIGEIVAQSGLGRGLRRAGEPCRPEKKEASHEILMRFRGDTRNGGQRAVGGAVGQQRGRQVCPRASPVVGSMVAKFAGSMAVGAVNGQDRFVALIAYFRESPGEYSAAVSGEIQARHSAGSPGKFRGPQGPGGRCQKRLCGGGEKILPVLRAMAEAGHRRRSGHAPSLPWNELFGQPGGVEAHAGHPAKSMAMALENQRREHASQIRDARKGGDRWRTNSVATREVRAAARKSRPKDGAARVGPQGLRNPGLILKFVLAPTWLVWRTKVSCDSQLAWPGVSAELDHCSRGGPCVLGCWLWKCSSSR